MTLTEDYEFNFPEHIVNLSPKLRPAGQGVPNITPTQLITPYRATPVDLHQRPKAARMVHKWLYAGRLHVLQSEPGVGKTFLALWLCIKVMEAGGHVIYLDEEGGLELIHERLWLLGADPDMVLERFHYYPFEARSFGEADIIALENLIAEWPETAVVVLDSLPDFLAAAGLSEDSAQDVTRFVNTVLARFRAAGIAQIVLDHLPKPTQSTSGEKKRSRYSRGSGSKLSKADATILVEQVIEFDAHTSGSLKVVKTKDRRGQLDLPKVTEHGLPIRVEVTKEGVVITEDPLSAIVEYDPAAACRAEILEALSGQETPGLNFNSIDNVVTFQRKFVSEQLDSMVAVGTLELELGPRGAKIYRPSKSVDNQW